MSTRIFGMGSGSSPVPGPNFFWRRDTDGKCTGRHTFTGIRGTMGTASGQSLFKKGVKITTLDPTLPPGLGFLEVDEFESQDLPGGFCEITVTLTGYTEEGEFEFDREITYSSSCSLAERSMLENPNFLREVTHRSDREKFTKLYNGAATGRVRYNEDGTIVDIEIIDVAADARLGTWTDAVTKKWYDIIFVKNRRTFDSPVYEWVKTTANAGGLSDSELDKLGQRDNSPPGNPPSPPRPEGTGQDYSWLKTVAADTRSSNSASTHEAWEWRDCPEDIYDFGS